MKHRRASLSGGKGVDLGIYGGANDWHDVGGESHFGFSLPAN